jgi:hypothetical protein
MKMKMPSHSTCRVAAAGLIWICALMAGWHSMTTYAYLDDGANDDRAITVWPDESALPRDKANLTLVFFLHPKCPCTSATLTELENIQAGIALAGAAAPLLVVVPVTPSQPSDDWLDAPVVRSAAKLSMAEVVADRGGREARRFGVATSGTILAFAADGRRVFAGAITDGRGQEGANPGSEALAALLTLGLTSDEAFPTWGCPLVVEEAGPASTPPSDEGVF